MVVVAQDMKSHRAWVRVSFRQKQIRLQSSSGGIHKSKASNGVTIDGQARTFLADISAASLEAAMFREEVLSRNGRVFVACKGPCQGWLRWTPSSKARRWKGWPPVCLFCSFDPVHRAVFRGRYPCSGRARRGHGFVSSRVGESFRTRWCQSGPTAFPCRQPRFRDGFRPRCLLLWRPKCQMKSSSMPAAEFRCTAWERVHVQVGPLLAWAFLQKTHRVQAALAAPVLHHQAK